MTKDEPKVYNSSSSIYTGIATGANLTSIEDSKIDRLATNTAFDNLINIIKSRGTAEETGLLLFTHHMMMEKPEPQRISNESYNRLMTIVPDEVKALVVKNNFDKTYQNFIQYKNKNFDNFIYELMVLNHPFYSYDKILSKLKVKRIFSSDMIELSYSSTDPGICQHTLEIITEVFIRQYSDIKLNQSDAILRYFQQQLNESQKKLDDAEDQLLEFNKSNNIINYYEQSEHITIQKERFKAFYNELKMENNAAESVLKVLENKLTVRQQREVNNSDIIKLRNKIANLSIQISTKNYQAEFDSLNSQRYLDEISELHIESFKLQEELRNAINKAYFIDNSSEGLNARTVLNQWLEKVIEYESTRAKLIVGQEKIQEFNRLVTEYAPKGATMKRLERKIDIAEREYLSILHSLNVAKLKQQNIELNSNLKVSEPPLFPLKSQPSKRKMLLMVGIVLGFLIPAFIVIALDYLDQNIKTAKRAEKFTGLKVASVFPKLTKIGRNIDIEAIQNSSLDAVTRRLIFNKEQNKSKSNETNTNLFFSIQDNEGKSTLLELLLERLATMGYKILLITNETPEEDTGFDICSYKIDNTFHVKENVADFVANDSNNEDTSEYDFVFIEIPGILNNSYPINLFKAINHSFLITRANRAWANSDSNALKDILEYIPENKPQVILNGVELQEMENVIGDLPKRRTFIRRLIKNIIQFRFYSKRGLTNKQKKARKKNTKISVFFVAIPVLTIFLINIIKGDKEQFITDSTKQNQESNYQLLNTTNKSLSDDTETKLKNNIPNTSISSENVSDSSNRSNTILKSTDPKNTEKNNQLNKNKPEEQSITEPNQQKSDDLYFVICESFSKKQNAKNLFDFLIKQNFNPTYLNKNNNLITVALGGFETKDEAKGKLKNLQKTNPKSDAWIYKKQEK